MKNTFIAFMLGASSCAGPTSHVTNHHTANGLVAAYAKMTSPDPASYRPVSFGAPEPVGLGELITGHTGVKTLPGAVIKHTYWGQNGFGVLALNTAYFVVDSTTKKVDLLDNVVRANTQQTMKTLRPDAQD